MSESSDRIPAFGYLRVSGKSQIDGDGFPRQREAIERYAAANGYEIVRWFEEKGISGTLGYSDRPAFTEMLEALLSNGVRTVIAETLNRIARELMVQESIVGYLRSKSLTLITTDADDVTADTDDPMREAMRQIQGIFAQLEKQMLVKKLRGARERIKSRDGRCEGRKPYGFRQGETQVIEHMRAMQSTGMSCERIAAALNERDIQTRYGKQWTINGVARILRRAR